MATFSVHRTTGAGLSLPGQDLALFYTRLPVNSARLVTGAVADELEFLVSSRPVLLFRPPGDKKGHLEVITSQPLDVATRPDAKGRRRFGLSDLHAEEHMFVAAGTTYALQVTGAPVDLFEMVLADEGGAIDRRRVGAAAHGGASPMHVNFVHVPERHDSHHALTRVRNHTFRGACFRTYVLDGAAQTLDEMFVVVGAGAVSVSGSDGARATAYPGDVVYLRRSAGRERPEWNVLEAGGATLYALSRCDARLHDVSTGICFDETAGDIAARSHAMHAPPRSEYDTRHHARRVRAGAPAQLAASMASALERVAPGGERPAAAAAPPPVYKGRLGAVAPGPAPLEAFYAAALGRM